MNQKLRNACAVFGAPLILILSSGSAFAETVLTWKTQGVAVIDIVNTTMADGSIVQSIKSRYVETGIDGDFKGQSVGGECVGLGQVTAEGVYSGKSRCTTTLSADDALTFDFNDNAEGGDWIVTGGKGKFKGATGKGHTAYVWGDTVFGDKITTAVDGKIILP